WSPDGREVAFERTGFDFTPEAGIFTVAVGGRSARRVTSPGTSAFDRSPSWSPDGRSIAFDRRGGVFVVDARGGEPRRVAAGRAPAWSPAGRLIAFLRR